MEEENLSGNEKKKVITIFKKKEIPKEQVVELTIVKEEKWFIIRMKMC